MKILHVIDSVDPKRGGPVEWVRQLDAFFPVADIVSEVACCDDPLDDWVVNSDLLKVHAFGPHSFGTYRYAPRLRQWLIENASYYDAVIVHGVWQYNLFAVWRALRKTDTPYFVYTHGMLDPWFNKTYRLKRMKKWLYWPWGAYPAIRDAKAVLYTCEEERLLARHSFWLFKSVDALAPYGIAAPPDNEAQLVEEFLSSFPELRGKRLILFLSRIQEKKGCDLLIEAFAKSVENDHSLRLVMAGPDQEGWGEVLRDKAKALGIDAYICWAGMLRDGLKWGAFFACDVFCLPSHQENFGIVVAEALSCGKPVLITDKVNIWREVREYDAGFVGADSVDGVRLNIGRWLDLSRDEYDRMSVNAKKCFAANYHINAAAANLIRVIQSSVGGRT